ncbi:MAG: ribbon-helix-helix protein, CopG family [Gemmatimonadota bacterium]|nr:ribbon-helix-helix protein, CopG family [Gemmatimonadota bacterium]
MTKYHEPPKRAGRAAEPVQVYLDRPDRERLERLAERLDTTKSDVLRRGLEALESLTRRRAGKSGVPGPLPTFAGQGLQPGVDLDDTASLLDLMEGDATR